MDKLIKIIDWSFLNISYFIKLKLSLASFILCILFIPLFTCSPHFMGVDDVSIMRMISGAYSELNDHKVIYIHPFLTFIIKQLYYLSNNIPWYSIVLYILLYISIFLIILYLIDLKCKKVFFITLIFLLPFIILAITDLHYTMVAGFCFIGGVCLFQIYTNKNIFIVSLSVLLILCSYLLRDSLFLLLTLVTIPLFTYKKNNYSNRLSKFTFVIFIAIVIILLNYVKSSFYTGDWKSYYDFSKIQGWATDYQFNGYEDNPQVYKEIGWTYNDYLVFKNWLYYDSDKYSTQKITYLVKSSLKNHITQNLHKNFPAYFFYSVFLHSWKLMSSIFVLLLLIKLTKKEERFKIVLPWLLVMVIIVILSLVNRVIPSHILNPLIVLAILISLSLVQNRKIDRPANIRSIVWIALFMLIQLYIATNYFTEISNNKATQSNFIKIINSLPRNSLILNWDSSLPFEWTPVFVDSNFFKQFHIIGSGWPQRSPYDNKVLHGYTQKSIYQYLLNNKNAYIIATPYYQNLLKVYYIENFNKNISIKLIQDFTPFETQDRYGYGGQLIQIFEK